MPAESKSQQRLMGMVNAYKEGKLTTKGMDPALAAKIRSIASSIKKSDAQDMAETKHKGLPEKVAQLHRGPSPTQTPVAGAGLTGGTGPIAGFGALSRVIGSSSYFSSNYNPIHYVPSTKTPAPHIRKLAEKYYVQKTRELSPKERAMAGVKRVGLPSAILTAGVNAALGTGFKRAGKAGLIMGLVGSGYGAITTPKQRREIALVTANTAMGVASFVL